MMTLLFILILLFSSSAYIDAQNYEGLAVPEIWEYNRVHHFAPLCQDSTLVCWSFATTSFVESEMMRNGKKTVRLSVFYFVYYRFYEKMQHIFSVNKPEHFSPGDLFNGVFDIVKKYGIVPAAAYEGEKKLNKKYNHNLLYAQLDSLVKHRAFLSEQEALKKTRLILNEHLGSPPDSFLYDGKWYSPHRFRDSVVALPWKEYIFITSFRYAPYYCFTTLNVPDNWKHSKNYYNIPLSLFTKTLQKALNTGYSVLIDADISEPSYKESGRWCIVQSNLSDHIDNYAQERERMFVTGETTDDHLMHLVGIATKNDEEWYLAKDSWPTAWVYPPYGYMYLHRSYIIFKVLAYVVHRSVLLNCDAIFQKHELERDNEFYDVDDRK